MEPVYGIAILEKSLLLDEEAAINKYWLTNSRSGKQLKAYYKNGKHQNLLQVAFLELDKYNKDENLTDAGRQWLEFFGNLPFTKAPSQAVAHADSLLDSSSWTKEEKTMIDERIRIQENYDMTLETAIDEAREEGLEQGRKQLVLSLIHIFEIQSRIVQVLDNFDMVCNDLNIGLPKEIELRQKQYEYFREKLLTFVAEGEYTDSTVQTRHH